MMMMHFDSGASGENKLETDYGCYYSQPTDFVANWLPSKADI